MALVETLFVEDPSSLPSKWSMKTIPCGFSRLKQWRWLIMMKNYEYDHLFEYSSSLLRRRRPQWSQGQLQREQRSVLTSSTGRDIPINDNPAL